MQFASCFARELSSVFPHRPPRLSDCVEIEHSPDSGLGFDMSVHASAPLKVSHG